MDSKDWIGYLNKAGELLYFHKTETDDYRWNRQYCACSKKKNSRVFDPVPCCPMDRIVAGLVSNVVSKSKDKKSSSGEKDERSTLCITEGNIKEKPDKSAESTIGQLSGNIKNEHVNTEHVNTGQVNTEHVDTEHVNTEHGKEDDVSRKNSKKGSNSALDLNLWTRVVQGMDTAHECLVCFKTFRHMTALKLHKKTHPKYTNCKNEHRHVEKPNAKRLPFQCSFCFKSFPTDADLMRHETRHTDKRLHKCSRCSWSFPTERELERHGSRHTADKPHTCYNCGKGFAGAVELERHVYGVEPFKCDFCDKAFNTPGALEKHARVHSVTRPYECKECGNSYAWKESLKAHMMLHAEKSEVCDVCGKCFTFASNLKQHMRIHSDEKPYECELCNLRFVSQRYLKKHHERKHTVVERRFPCEECGKKFKCRVSLKAHVATHDDNRKKPFVCQVCGKAFMTKFNLDGHSETHTDNKPFVCETCGKAFRKEAHLSRHYRLHAAQTMFQCQQCGVRFGPSVRSLDRNLGAKIETQDLCKLCKPKVNRYQCKYCDKPFFRTYEFKKHLMIHTGERPLTCHICEEGFIWPGRLKIHLQNHEGVKPYICSVCGKGFSTKGSLTTHREIHDGKKLFECSQCRKTFRSKSHLQRHIQQMHLEKKLEFKYKCKACTMEYTRKNDLLAHQKTHTGELRFQCSDCGKGFATYSGMARHKKKQHYKFLEFACDKCDKAFPLRYELARHKRTMHVDEKPFQCSHCMKVFDCNSMLKRHAKIHERNTNSVFITNEN